MSSQASENTPSATQTDGAAPSDRFPAPRTKLEAWSDLCAKFASLGYTDSRRGPLARMIVGLEDEIFT